MSLNSPEKRERQLQRLSPLYYSAGALLRFRGLKAPIYVILLCLLPLSACISPSEAALLPTFTPPLPTHTPTATIVWFPPTATPTPPPTPVITPTIDLRPQVGNILFEDKFDKADFWSLTQNNYSSIALGKNEITIAIAQPKTYLYTLRSTPQVSNFYLELILWPNLCQGEDEYGILFRVTPNLDFYRLALTCNGQLRLDRFYQGKAAVIYPKTYSGAVPPGAPSIVPIGVYASKKEITVFINDQFQFTLQESVIPAGGIGLFARSVSSASVTINYSDLTVYELIP